MSFRETDTFQKEPANLCSTKANFPRSNLNRSAPPGRAQPPAGIAQYRFEFASEKIPGRALATANRLEISSIRWP